jgi:hypothetical protein
MTIKCFWTKPSAINWVLKNRVRVESQWANLPLLIDTSVKLINYSHAMLKGSGDTSLQTQWLDLELINF